MPKSAVRAGDECASFLTSGWPTDSHRRCRDAVGERGAGPVERTLSDLH